MQRWKIPIITDPLTGEFKRVKFKERGVEHFWVRETGGKGSTKQGFWVSEKPSRNRLRVPWPSENLLGWPNKQS